MTTIMSSEVAADAAEPPEVVMLVIVFPEVMVPAAVSPKVAADAAEPPEAAVLSSVPCMVVTPSSALSTSHVMVEGAIGKPSAFVETSGGTAVEPLEVVVSAAEPPEVSVVSTYQLSACPVTAIEAVCEASLCPVTAPALSAPPWRSPALSAPPWKSPALSAPHWWALVLSALPWWSPVPVWWSFVPPWWAPVPSVPPWWALVPSVPPWRSPVLSVQPWRAPVLSAPPWYSALPALARFLVWSLPHSTMPVYLSTHLPCPQYTCLPFVRPCLCL